MIGIVRYGFLGYHDGNVALALGVLALATATRFAVNLRLFVTGYRLRA
jgi:ABC-2 type transport system permease protein